MKQSIKILAVALLFSISAGAFAGSCPKDMKAIDAALAENPSISAETMERVKELRALGEKQHKSGQHADSVTSLHEALKLLGK